MLFLGWKCEVLFYHSNELEGRLQGKGGRSEKEAKGEEEKWVTEARQRRRGEKEEENSRSVSSPIASWRVA